MCLNWAFKQNVFNKIHYAAVINCKKKTKRYKIKKELLNINSFNKITHIRK